MRQPGTPTNVPASPAVAVMPARHPGKGMCARVPALRVSVARANHVLSLPNGAGIQKAWAAKYPAKWIPAFAGMTNYDRARPDEGR